MVLRGCARVIGSHVNDRLLVAGIRWSASTRSRAPFSGQSMRPTSRARANPAFTLHQANILEVTAGAAPGGPESGGAEGCAFAVLLRGWTSFNLYGNGSEVSDVTCFDAVLQAT